MHIIPKRLLLIAALPAAVAAMYGGSLAFAQSGEQPTPAPTEDAAPTTPDSTTPDDGRGCPEKGGSGESDSTESGTSTQIRTRARASSARPF